ncbi:MAG: hypothetical protein JW959_08185 [Pirellulales bacterium]|nr:hypothetical protein [Pirellulales bacterium]
MARDIRKKDNIDRPRSPLPADRTARQSFSRYANWTVGLAAVLLVLISAGGYFHHQRQLSDLAGEHLRLIVTGPSAIQAGLSAEYTISTTAIDGRAWPAEIEAALLALDGERIVAVRETADDNGRLKVVVAPDEQLPERVELKVAADYRGNREEAEIELAVLPEPFDTRLTLDRPRYRPGDTVRFRSLTLSRFGLEEPPAGKVRFEMVGPRGLFLPGPTVEAVVRRGVAGGTFAIPSDAPSGRYKLVVRGEDDFPPDSEMFIVGSDDESTRKIERGDSRGTNLSSGDEPSADQPASLKCETDAFDAGAPLEFNVRSSGVGRPLIAAAYAKGAQIGQQPLLSAGNQTAGQPVQIPLDDVIGGPILLVLYDYGATPPQPMDMRTVHRRPGQKLDVKLSGIDGQYAPGESVELSLLVADELGRPVPAAIGVEVEEAVGSVRNGGEPTTSEIIPRFDEARRRPPGVRPPMLCDNLERIKADYENSTAEYQSNLSGTLNTLTAASFFGGLGLVVLVMMLGLMRLVSGIHFWASAVAATTCCCILGAILMDPGPAMEDYDGVAPYASYTAQPETIIDGDYSRPSGAVSRPAEDEADKTVYWNPLLAADGDGRATMRFDLPETPGTCFITVEAHGNGRIGAAREKITVRPPANETAPQKSKTGE